MDICSMYILIAAATPFEVQPTVDWLNHRHLEEKGHTIETCITGVGMLAATYRLTSRLQVAKPDYLFQAGIAGAFGSELALGTTLFIEEEIPGDMGVEENQGFSDLFDLGLVTSGSFPFTGRTLRNPSIGSWQEMHTPGGKGITINEITTRPERIRLLREKYGVDVESMEGAACHYTCLQMGVPFLQIRSISNYVGERDKTRWKIKEAIRNLNEKLIGCLEHLTK